MARLVQIHYTLAPNLQAKQWVKDELRLSSALKPSKKILRGEIPDAAWSRYEHFAWQEKDNVWVLRADSVPIKTYLQGTAEVTIMPMHRIGVKFKMDEAQRSWTANKVYEDPVEALEALRLQTLNDFAHPATQETIGDELSQILSSLYAEWDLPNLEEKFATYALKIGKLVHDYHAQWQRIEWLVRPCEGVHLETGGYAWSSQSPLQYEALRLLYYITQSFSFIDKKDGNLWVSPATAMSTTLDLGFLNTRVHVSDGFTSTGVINGKHHPGDVVMAKTWLSEVKAFVDSSGLEPLGEDVLRVIWNTAVIFDYLPRLAPDTDLVWAPSAVRQFLLDAEYRNDILKLIPDAALQHKTYLDEAKHFWEQGGFAGISGGIKKTANQVFSALRDYFVWQEAKDAGFGLPAIAVYKEEDILVARRRFQGGDVIKKIEPLLQTLEERGPNKYSALAPNDAALDAVAARFPNFKKIISEVKKQLRLARLQPFPVIKLPPMLIVGDPGWGKTRFLKAMSDALKLPFNEIPMSSVTAGFVLSGGDLMWHSAKHGRIADIFMHGVCINPMIVLDELDKVSGDKHDPYGPLYQLLENHTAERFVDEALNVPLATQYISWCATANDISLIPEPIQTRFDVYEVPPLSIDETPIVAQSIFDDLRAANLWGDAFHPTLSLDFATKLHGMNARGMYFALRSACANASERDERPLVLQVSDLQERGNHKVPMGFTG